MSDKLEVLKGISAVSAMLSKEGITKSRKNQQQGYNFRGIDEVLNALSPMLVEAGLVIVPHVLSREVTERATKSGGALFYVCVHVEYDIISVADGSIIKAHVYGEAMDSADKATNKAMSAAYKYMAIQTFAIPTVGDNDADATTHEVAANPTGSLSDRAKAMPSPKKANNPIPPQVLGVLDALNDMPQITAKCSEYKSMAQKEGWDRELFRYWQKRDQQFKTLQNEVFGDEDENPDPDAGDR